jgi:hypothetical protein
MARIRKGKNPLSVAARRLVAKKRRRSAHSEAPNGELGMVQRVTEFPKPATPDDVVSNRIIFDVGGDRFAMTWTAEIEELPPAGPVVVERKPLAESGPFASRNAAAIEAGIQDVRRSRRGTNPVRVTEQKGEGD